MTQPLPRSLEIQLWLLPNLPSLMCSSRWISELGNTLEALALVPALARAIFLGFGSEVKTSSSSMQGSASLVRVMVKRRNLALMEEKRSTFLRPLTGARRKWAAAWGSDGGATADSFPLTPALSLGERESPSPPPDESVERGLCSVAERVAGGSSTMAITAAVT